MRSVAGNLARLKTEIAELAVESGREEGAVTLVAVSKQQPEARIDAALAAGQRVFGENRVQEAFQRWTPRRAACPDLSLHLIGPLQTNKAGAAVALFDVIETIDRVRLADSVRDEMTRQNKSPRCLVQVNTGAEAQKAGVAIADCPSLLAHCRKIGLPIQGLMCIPPVDEPPAVHFALLGKMAGDFGLEILSMGMSADYDRAIALGATHIRLGRAVFGPRIVHSSETPG